ncbi:hypothetical protein NITLEN_20637 [Nitrospira lenta]|uniref:Uncharacterized protein n=1 Tax=Nitrospira lenta TaxID=1436998 RepID=A0A330L5M3_9BACT|nr:hypothetical protein NITLEN_20637 [Nitrospira lenta]
MIDATATLYIPLLCQISSDMHACPKGMSELTGGTLCAGK